MDIHSLIHTIIRRENEIITLQEKKSEKIRAPPSLTVNNVKNLNVLCDMVKQLQNIRTFSEVLNEQKYNWHSYDNKQNIPIKVLAAPLLRIRKYCQRFKDRNCKMLTASLKLK